MCGFAALFEPGRRFDTQLLAGIEHDLHHRGPDSGGSASEPGFALVFRRLAILDPTPGSDQPMTDPSGRCTLVFNGEIYNYRELREELINLGVSLRTTGDTEVLLQGYMTWGEAVLDRLEGMFAFVLVDRHRGLALAARDPFGIKPLYLLRAGRLVGLASEMRPFARLVPPEPDTAALAELLTFNWAAGRLSNLRGIDRVPGGTLIELSITDGTLRERRFCDPCADLGSEEPMDADKAAAIAREAVEKSVRDHLRSDVGYTVQLSGGVDSSLVSALAVPQTPTRLVTFGINLGGYEHDESAYRKLVVQRHGLDHREVPMDGIAYADALPRAVRHMEGPVPHGACVFLMLLCDRIREVSKVVLTGEGADEFFGGYQRYATWHRIMWRERIAHLLPRSWWPNGGRLGTLRRYAGRDAAAYASVYQLLEPIHKLFPDLVPTPGAREAASARFRDFRRRLFACDRTAYLESLLVRQDKMAMAASVEARVPFTHLPLARAVNRIPLSILAPGGITKPLLKDIARAHLPGAVIDRRKIGLLLPYDLWLADQRLLGRYLELLSAPDSRLGRYAVDGGLGAAVERYRAGDTGLTGMLNRLIGIELWLRGLEHRPSAAA